MNNCWLLRKGEIEKVLRIMNIEQLKFELLLLKELSKLENLNLEIQEKFLSLYPINSDFKSYISILRNPEYDLDTIINLIKAECKSKNLSI